MSVVLQSQSSNLKATGNVCNVPPYDVCRLSYYLKCGTAWCGINVISAYLLDFSNAHKLSQQSQDTIVRLANVDYNDAVLLGKTIILREDSDELLNGKSNEFYEIENINSLIALDSSTVLIAGAMTEVMKIMVCNKQWLDAYYYNPLRRITAGRQQGVKSSIDDLAHAISASLKVKNGSAHCTHCQGEDVSCSCTKGCPPKAGSQCHVVHRNSTCDGCGQHSIKGPRYKCATCYDYDLCSTCYCRGVHDKTHPFNEILRVGSTLQPLSPRETKRYYEASAPFNSPSAPPYNPNYVEADVPVCVEAPVAEASTGGVFREGQSVRLKNMSDPRQNGASARIVKNIGGNRLVVILLAENKKVTVKPENLEVSHPLIPIGTIVELKDLKTQEHRNGMLGEVVESPLDSFDRVTVQLYDDENSIVRVKPENLEVIEDVS